MTCEDCGEAIAADDEKVSNEAGDFHRDCYDRETAAEEAYWRPRSASAFAGRLTEQHEAYEPGDPKGFDL